MKNIILAYVLSILFIPLCSLAEDKYEYEEIEYKVNKESHPVAQFLLFEGLIAGLSWVGAEYNDSYAKVFVITHPWAMAEAFSDRNDTLLYTSMIIGEAMALYTTSLDDEKYGQSERFKKNMIAWHVAIGIIISTEWLTVENDEETVAMSVAPLIDGGALNISFRY